MIERPNATLASRQLDEWSEVIWYVVVTMTTIGYGDIIAQTSVTRTIVIFLLIWGNFWSSIFISVLFPYVQLGLFEKKALNQYRRTKLRGELRELCKKVVGQLVMINYYSKQAGKEEENKERQLSIFKVLRKIKVVKKKLAVTKGQTNNFIDEILGNLK